MTISLDQKAYDAGYHAGEKGKPSDSCPYERNSVESLSWHSGFIEGKDSDLYEPPPWNPEKCHLPPSVLRKYLKRRFKWLISRISVQEEALAGKVRNFDRQEAAALGYAISLADGAIPLHEQIQKLKDRIVYLEKLLDQHGVVPEE